MKGNKMVKYFFSRHPKPAIQSPSTQIGHNRTEALHSYLHSTCY
jgi:hypothetical protein